MSKITNEQRKQIKEKVILDSAKIIFQEKGFLDVTMRDIIEKANISRGGIYLYFKSVDEIFIAVLKQRNDHSLDNIRTDIESNISFSKLLNKYFDGQKDRLLNRVDSSLLRAVYEYYFTHKETSDRQFQQEQFNVIQQTILLILQYGVSSNALQSDHLDVISEQIMFLIEGLSVLALTGGITEQKIDSQFELIKSNLNWK
ncbi:TetR/AcrR family transcriptional regulator [Pediococcus claussenii]|uniref:Transcriptional regulator, TetR family n=1 Tax=Pediococcus claussenii (strain ATCC BAA-344 / DSM 14800 / JCM 18046 / KCTC 3811 / LMG 21948 / P06) TaxID=701521 RepID=G8PA84_PEDCP|nr:TetR/AcrR family transcriptional regulator [Pediococcus claussenii]AEV94523.1 Transcriptional regulator, TetR family [Pediococcus claussenii ATCC BAA-344]ANZ69741.1 TetR family transcriptional regulator [Pediococcus claussenii]ANZ71558.1 TetR family transcriptional regulator [Pediococcus claussenii]KRN19770.1 hypothetical protein IV79_GL001058 [Pediococcus claussenii]